MLKLLNCKRNEIYLKPFQEIPPATPPGVVIMELAWNPVMPSMHAVVFSDGSLALHMINDKGFDSATLPPAEKICCKAKLFDLLSFKYKTKCKKPMY